MAEYGLTQEQIRDMSPEELAAFVEQKKKEKQEKEQAAGKPDYREQAQKLLKSKTFWLVVVVVVLLVLMWWQWEWMMDQVSRLKGSDASAASTGAAAAASTTAAPERMCSCKGAKCTCERFRRHPKAEYLADPEDDVAEDAAVLNELGYESDMPWSEVLANTELDPSVGDNHRQFVADVRRFSSGANFTSVADDNTNSDFNNFVGLRRPQHVHIGADARQIPDIEESVLQRNKDLRW